MPAYKAREVKRALTNKLQCEVKEAGKHTLYRVFVGDKLFRWTAMSRNNQEIGNYLQGKMAEQLGVTTRTFRGIVDCTVACDDYLEEARASQ